MLEPKIVRITDVPGVVRIQVKEIGPQGLSSADIQSHSIHYFSVADGNLVAGQTSFVVPNGYTPGRVKVYLDGVRLAADDFTANDGLAVVFSADKILATSVVLIERLEAFFVADVPGKATAGQATSGVDDTTFMTPLRMRDALPATPITATGSTTGRTLPDRFSDVVNVKDFGALGDGSNADAAFDAAVAKINSQGRGTLVAPPGAYKINTPKIITVSDVVVDLTGATIDASEISYSTTLVGTGAVFAFKGVLRSFVLLAAPATAGSYTIELASTVTFAVGQFIRIQSPQPLQFDGASVIAYYVDVNRIVGISGNTITLEHKLKYDFSITGYEVKVYNGDLIRNAEIRGGRLLGGGVRESLINGIGPIGVYAYYVDGFRAVGGRYEGFQGFAGLADSCLDVVWDGLSMEGAPYGTTIVEGQTSGFYGVSSTRCRNSRAMNLYGHRVRHVIDGADTYGMHQLNSRGSMTHRAAFGSHGGVRDLVVDDCTTIECYAGGVVRAFSSSWGPGNRFDCSGSGVSTANMTAGSVPGELTFDGGVYRGSDAGAFGVVVTGYYKNLSFRGVAAEGPAGGISLQQDWIDGLTVQGGDLTSSNAASNGFQILNQCRHLKNVVIDGPVCRGFKGNAVTIRGSSDIANPADGIFVQNVSGFPAWEGSGNLVLLRSEGYYGDTVEVRGNKMYGDSSEVVGVGTAFQAFASAPVVEDNRNFNPNTRSSHRVGGTQNTTSLNGNATLLAGAIIENLTPGASQPIGYIVTSRGTEGTITGVTGAIAASSTTLTLAGNDGVKVYRGSIIDVAGAGASGAVLVARVTALSADGVTATLDIAAGTTVAGAAVVRRNPVLKAFATVAA